MPKLARPFSEEEKRRHALAGLSFPEKVLVVIKLQEMAAPVLRVRGKNVRPWRPR
ncbi:MAG TPA: hypothetical protein VNY07_10155 [Chthoniobacterales bacterium]|jgi:hypothetical protein|nr:hypothetical protein [Chthoniobacterales bacterium]